MPDIVLKPTDPLLHHRLDSFVERLQDEGYSVQLERPAEFRLWNRFPPEIVAVLVIQVGAVILDHEYEKIKQFFREWFTAQPPPRDRRLRRRVQVRVEDEIHQLFDQFEMEDEPVPAPEEDEEEDE